MKIGLKLIVAAFAVLFFAACGKDDNGGKKGGTLDDGSWVLTSWNDSDALAGKVYLQLNRDGTFVSYQNISAQGFTQFKGAYRIDQVDSKPVLTGVYSDGQQWAERYLYGVDGNTMVLQAYPNGVVSIYTATTIPDFVKTTKAARSADEKPFL